MKSSALIISCEHAVNDVPAQYTDLFQSDASVLQTHRAIDFGADLMATRFAEAFSCPCIKARVTRLLIDCNRSIKHPRLFSEWTKPLPPAEKKILIESYYQPFREPLIHCIKQHLDNGQRVIHLSIHSFTPILNGIKRTVDIGFLYDPSRTAEKTLARRWKQSLAHVAPNYRVRMNVPYQGTSDGFTQELRQQFPNEQYLGLEVECNQAITQFQTPQEMLIKALITSLSELSL